MQQDNSKTLQSYEEHVKEYIQRTPQAVSGDVKDWIDRALTLVPKTGTILELGSAFGRDAAYIENKGFTVERTDATKAFIELLQGQGLKARVLNAISDDFGSDYAMVFANAVLLHFSPDETKRVLAKALRSLQQDGILAFTVKRGDGEKWTEDKLGAPRYFCFWQPDKLRQVVTDAGFEIVSLTTGETRNAEWIQVIARKA